MSDVNSPSGNLYAKYTTRNPISRLLMKGFLNSLDELVSSISPSSIHEVGCGEGYLISRFDATSRILRGTDSSVEVITRARSLNPGATGKVTFEVKSLYDLEKSKDSAELILCCEVLEHLHDPEGALAILSELASPYLIASVPSEPLWRILNMARGAYWYKLGNTPGHINHWSKQAFLNLILSRFELIRFESPIPWNMALFRTRI